MSGSRVIIADDHALVRDGMRRLLEDDGEFHVVAEAAATDELFRQLHGAGADLVLLDISMPGTGALETLRRLQAQWPAVRVLVVTMHSEPQFATRVLRAGAAGYLTKHNAGTELLAALRRVRNGHRYIDRTLAEELAETLVMEPAQTAHSHLSDREYEVLRHLGSGHHIKGIATLLHLSPKTVSTYRTRVMEKLGLKSNLELMRYVMQHRLDEAP